MTLFLPPSLLLSFLTERGGDPAPDADLGTERNYLAPQAPPTTTTTSSRRRRRGGGQKGTGKEGVSAREGTATGTEAGGGVDEGIVLTERDL
jgi:hypothetical protein